MSKAIDWSALPGARLRRSRMHVAAYLLALIPAYVLLTWASGLLGAVGGVFVWFPPAGLIVAACAVFGWSAVPPLVIGHMLAGVLVFRSLDALGPWLLLLNALGNVVVYAGVAALLGQLRLLGSFIDLRRAMLMIGLGVFAAPLLAGMFGMSVRVFSGLSPPDAFWSGALVWMIGDAIGITSLTPALLMLFDSFENRRVPPAFGRVSRPVAITYLALPLMVGFILFQLPDAGNRFLYLVICPVLLIAARLGFAGVAVCALLLSPTMTWLAGLSVGDTLLPRLDLQVLLLATLLAGFVVGVMTDATLLARLHRSRLGELVQASTDLVAVLGADRNIRYLNPAGRRMLGIPANEPAHRLRMNDFLDGDIERQYAEEALRTAARDGSWRGESRLTTRDGQSLLASSVVIAHRGGDDRVKRFGVLIRDLTEERRLEEELHRRSLVDPVTGLGNRVVFRERLIHCISRAAADDTVHQLILLKLDRYRQLAQALGPESADAGLREVGQRIRTVADQSDTVVRLEGSSFAVVTGEPMTQTQAFLLASGLCTSIRQAIELGSRSIRITASAGVAEIGGDASPADVVRAADVAAHRARDLGGDRVVRHAERMTADAAALFDQEESLRNAHEHGHWRLGYQPIAQAGSLEVTAGEALLRFDDDDSPFDRICIAERNGLIVPLGSRILEQACLQGAAWNRAGHNLRVGVNVSRRQLEHPGFMGELQRHLHRSEFPPERLTLEVTESVLEHRTTRLARTLNAVRELGVSVALDDFGTGYSSLAQLAHLPIDVLKLDRSFILALGQSRKTNAMVQSVLYMARDLGLRTVAEGVESQAQASALEDFGCNMLQGYLIGHAVPPDAFPAERATAPSQGPDNT